MAEKYSSSMSVNMEKEYVFHNYKYMSKENSPVYGAESADDVVISPLYFDELCYVLSSEGTHVVLFGGTWSEKTQGVIDRINFLARRHGVDTVYNFDFRADGVSEDTNFKVDITAQDTYDGPGKVDSVGCANCNYIYGELVSRHLTNLNDWVTGKVGSGDDITWLNLYQDAVTVPNLHEPFIFVFNKDNRVNNSGSDTVSEFYPIVSAMEISCCRGEDGTLYTDETCAVPEDLDAELEEKIFGMIGEEGVTPYTHADYMYDAFKMNERGHAFKTEDCFKKGEQINIQPVTLHELLWILDQEGTFMVLFAGAWCANSQGGVTTINDYAVANDTRVYMLDKRLDGKYPIDFWKYPRLNELSLSHPNLYKYNFEIWDKRLPGAPMLFSLRADDPNPERRPPLVKEYTDEEGITHTILPVDLPYIVACNKDNVGEHDHPQPVLAACSHGGIELINCKRSFVYYEPNYRLYSAGLYAVYAAYCESEGTEVKERLVDRTAPIAEGEPVQHVETVAYHRDHDWYREKGQNS